MTLTFGERALDACLRRGQQSEALKHDLVLVRDHVVLRDVSASAVLLGEEWRIQRVTGELTLRDALPEASRLLAIVPPAFVPPLDIAGRAWLRKPVELRADDIVAALTGRDCEPLPEDEVGAAVLASLDRLRDQSSRWSQHGIVTAAEVRAVLVAAELGTDERLDRERDSDLLARWIIDRAPTTRIPEMLERALVEAHPRTGRWLAYAARTGDIPGLVAAGALAELTPETAVEPVPRSPGEWRELRNLVDLALRQAWRVAPERARAALATAEQLAHRRRITEQQAPRLPLVRAALDQALFDFAHRCADGDPPDDGLIDALRANIHADDANEEIAQVRDLARLARATRTALPPADWVKWAWAARDHIGWFDLAIRRIRRRAGGESGAMAEATKAILSRAFAWRDVWNRAFAETFSANWGRVNASKDLRAPLPLAHVSRSVVARLVDAGERVFLVVLDGGDLSTFTEIAEALPPGLGLRLPAVADGPLRDDLAAIGPFHVAISPVPTVTSHARRAIFAGEIPGNASLTDSESVVANSTADKQAFSRNAALRQHPRTLFLKGDLADPSALIAALRSGNERIVAAVFNGVDDALSSKETTALAEWSLAALGGGALDAIRFAADHGWTVVVTADHGHTPFLAGDRKVAASALGARFGAEPLPGSVEFREGPLPFSPLHCLVALGHFCGPQHRGFHGGAGIEEMIVPLAFLGRVEGAEGRPRPPSWWWTGAATEELAPAPEPVRVLGAPPSVPGSDLSDGVQRALASQPLALRALAHLARAEVLTMAQLCVLLGQAPFIVGGVMSRCLALLARAGVSAPFVEEESGGERRYRWVGGRG
ncbi:hypothetical protein LBMAG42_03480 [Deltaproteobacteria bacterium]|nr:hypothetical protein LBMAG42_03480 [Deltaproteobacteria bacterium]